DVLVEIETDKAVMEYEAYEDGYLVQQTVGEGETVPIGAVIGVIADSPDAVPADSGGAGAAEQAAAPEQAPQPEVEEVRPAEEAPPTVPAQAAPAEPERGPRPLSSPLARRLAREYGLDITQIKGSGPKGRVVRADVEAAAKQREQEKAPAAAPQPAPVPAPAAARPQPPQPEFEDLRDSEEVPVGNIRKVIARRLTQAKQEAPHFYLRRTIDAEALREFRAQINEQLAPTGVKVSVNDLIVKAVATVLRDHPEVNSSWVDDKLLRHKRINVGIAVAVDTGLVVPVLHDADTLALSEVARRSRALVEKARDGKLSPQDMSGGTFSVSNLGMFGVESFSAVINPPEAAILAVGAMQQEPVVRDGEIVARHTIALELSVDHRAVDGAVGAAFLKDLAEVLESPMRIVL